MAELGIPKRGISKGIDHLVTNKEGLEKAIRSMELVLKTVKRIYRLIRFVDLITFIG